ncbi:MAG TPA: isopeptide-forming domain-containing fimbrial protein, partial [Gemmataceae bacterium]
MNWHPLFNWLPSRSARRMKRAQTPVPPWRFVVPRLERLESRIAPAVVTPFTPIFSQNATGDIAVVGNTLETASTVNNPGRTQADVTAAQNGTGANVNNNNWNMAYVDVDNDPTTFNSSQAALNLPAGATVLFAGLYWGSVTTTPAQAAARNTVKFSTPTSGGYVSLTGTTIGSTTFTGAPSGTIYESFANVTSLVQAAGNGTYEVANVQAALRDAQGNLEAGTYAGWSLVVAYSAPGAPARNLTVFNGFAAQASTDPALNIPISGFVAPPAGPVNAKVGVVAYEGDRGTTGDSMALNGKQLSDAATPANNFFDSGISNLGVLQTAKNPNFVNQMGFDAKVVNAPSGAIPNSATSATITLTTSGDGYFPGVVTTAIDLFAPNLVATKTVADQTSGNSLPGDTLEYTVNVTNTGQDAAGNVILTDPIPANTTYVPGSLRILTGANAGIMTDAAGDDQGTFDAAHNQVVFDLGAGAMATAGGTLGIGASTSIRFRVQISPGVAANTVIPNQAAINYKGVTTGFPFTSLSTAPAFTVANSVADVALAKTVSNPAPNVGDNVTFTVTATNNGPGPATGVTVSDLLPPGLQLANAITSQGEYDGGTGLWTVESLANGGVATLTIIATVLSPSPQTNTATISHTDSVDPNASNNQASATETPQLADLSVRKTVSNSRPNVGDTITYSVTVTNSGPNNATNVTLTDPLPAGLTFVSSSAGAAYDSTTGLWTVGTLANGASTVLTITAIVASPQATLNAATISHADQFDPNTSNNRAAAAVTPQQADLAL